MSEFLTVKEVAARWRVNKMTVYRLINAGELPAIQIGRSLRILRSDVEAKEQQDG